MSFANLELIETMYAKYLDDPQSVDGSWRDFFEKEDQEIQPIVTLDDQKSFPSDLRIYNLIHAYRSYGHLLAKINPIATSSIKEPWQLSLAHLGFSEDELSQPFPTCGLLPEKTATLQTIIDTLKAIYCDKIGIEYMGLQSPQLEKWLQERIEPNRFHIQLSIEQKQMILKNLNKSELLESFLHTKYIGQKRFSLEGGETLIPVLEAIIDTGAQLGIEEFIIGMAHRGRLNVLSNILNKSYSDIFYEFEDNHIAESFEGSGDVKYHKGFLSETMTLHGHKVNIAVTPNPSHLESVDPVVEGQVYARQILRNDQKKEIVAPILIHGDAALSGQGVVYETMQFYQLEGYSTGGTIHVVVNNQIGFTTLPRDARSTNYCTDIARAFGAPIFHVNAEDPEGCVYATILAVQLRQKFHCDVFVELNCYRKYGHNEADEPAFTQPLEYQLIRQKKPIREIYRDDLIQQGVLERKMAEALEAEFKQSLQEALKGIKTPLKNPAKEAAGASSTQHPLLPEDVFEVVQTGVPKSILQEIAQSFCKIPEGFKIHPKLEHLIKTRLSMVQEDGAKPVDWGMGELLAYGSLLWKKINVRIAGQDCCRGTFSHRHGMLMDQEKEQAYFPLKHLKKDQGRFDLINSPLSEFAALGFEFGYSIANPEALVIWEAQFGDFCNGGQVIIDEYITTAEQKWGQKFRLTLFLPHGYEGQGPDHSSARMERFLALAGNDNMTVAYPTSPAQLFHLLRRQAMRSKPKPLVVFTPKGLLRHPECVNPIEDFTQGSFQEIIDDTMTHKKVKRLVFCTGRIYYDLIAERVKRQIEDMAIIRIEQLYPLNTQKLTSIIEKYKDTEEVYWIQEEPKNMGAWGYIHSPIRKLLPKKLELKYIGRLRSASPAAGSYALHKKEHTELMDTLFGKIVPSIFELASQYKEKK